MVFGFFVVSFGILLVWKFSVVGGSVVKEQTQISTIQSLLGLLRKGKVDIGAAQPAVATQITIAERNEKSEKRDKRSLLASSPFLRLLSFFSALFSWLLSVLLARKARCCAFAVQSAPDGRVPSFPAITSRDQGAAR